MGLAGEVLRTRRRKNGRAVVEDPRWNSAAVLPESGVVYTLSERVEEREAFKNGARLTVARGKVRVGSRVETREKSRDPQGGRKREGGETEKERKRSVRE